MSGTAIRLAPAGAFVQTTSVRSYEVGRGGCIGVGTILRYLEALATEASATAGFDVRWYEQHNSAWVVREMDVLLGALPGIGDELTLATWVADFRRVQAQREYAAWRRADGRLVARASARWGYVDRLRGQPVRVQDEVASSIPVLGQRMPARALPAPAADGPATIRGKLLLTAREYETDSQQHINNCVYADWLAEGLDHALRLATAGDSMAARPRYYRIAYLRPALAGDEVRVTTVGGRLGTRGLAVGQEVAGAQDGGIFVRAQSQHLRVRE